MKYQFQIDFQPTGPVRDRWEEAANDAVQAGYATWSHPNHDEIKVSDQVSIHWITDTQGDQES